MKKQVLVSETAAERLAVLLQLERQSRQCTSFEAFGFFVVNETRRLLIYDRAVFWYKSGDKINIQAVSGVGAVEKETPFYDWTKKAVGSVLKSKTAAETCVIQASDMPQNLASEWSEFCTQTVLWVPFIHPVTRKVMGGLWLTRAQPVFMQQDAKAAELAADPYAVVFALWKPDSLKSPAKKYSKRNIIAAGALLLLMCFPVHMTVLAPAEIVPASPRFVTAPMNGVIESFLVKPGQKISAGMSLFQFENVSLRNQLNLTERSAATAMEEYHKAAQSAFASAQIKARLPFMKLEIEKARDELEHVKELLARSVVKAPADGIAVFSEANDWIGRPVIVGERILTIADPGQISLKIEVPVTEAIELQKGQAVKFFMHGMPAAPLKAEVLSVGFEPELMPERFLAYRVKASLDRQKETVRIGTRGIAKIYGDRVPFIYYALRRPLAVIRQALGV